MIYEYWFSCIRPLADQKKRCLRECIGTAEAIYYIEETTLRKLSFLTEKEVAVLMEAKKESLPKQSFNRLLASGISIIPYNDPKYPVKLKETGTPPYALYVKGDLPDMKRPGIAIVGARKCTPYGEQMALVYGEAFAKMGISVISGMARGIDGAGQRGALNGGGNTYGVLGCGVDICYPKEHLGLYMDIQKQGGLISEQPPGTPPLPMYFPARNRIISGMSDVVLVIEAKEKSGSLITADLALEQAKDVFALPGPVTSPLSQGCHRLISQGAGILISPEELMQTLGWEYIKFGQNSDKNKKMLETAENIVYSCLGLFPKGIQELVSETGISPKEVMEQLTTLELEGYIEEVSKNYYIRTRQRQ